MPDLAPVPYFLPLDDSAVQARHQFILAMYRQLATEHGVAATIPVCCRRLTGRTLNRVGPCDDQSNQQDWDFTDEPTAESYVFWVPRILSGSTLKTKQEQISLLANLRTRLELPAHHLVCFGSLALVSGLIAAHYKATSECIPPNDYWVRTDTHHSNGDTVLLHWRRGYFGAGIFGLGDDADDTVGVLALGVEVVN